VADGLLRHVMGRIGKLCWTELKDAEVMGY
jgi:hypothetical protein